MMGERTGKKRNKRREKREEARSVLCLEKGKEGGMEERKRGKWKRKDEVGSWEEE